MPECTKRNLRKIILLMVASLSLVLFALDTALCAAAFNKPDEIFRFAGHLMKEGDYSRAAREYERYIDMDVSSNNAKNAYKNTIICLAKLGDTSGVITELRRLYELQEKFKLTSDFWLELGQILEREKDYRNAAIAYRKSAETTAEADRSVCARLYEAKMYFLVGEDIQAIQILNKVKHSGQNIEKFKHLISLMESMEKGKKKEPRIAMFLSAVVPGTGHLYAGEAFHGISSFVLNAGLISAAYFSFKHDSPILGSFIAYLETGFYIGGIKSAGTDARKTNINNRRLFRNKLKKALPLEPNLCFGKKSASVQFIYRF
ncbi:MAG TPA: tetratricopeptide repeat protein [Deltaproteobacteria bacterium]|nr:tetratricopeptide repeat protein [Deltaproteobacteria bacterium]